MSRGVLCHQCGQDYAATYWAPSNGPTWLGRGADPFVCPDCQRDAVEAHGLRATQLPAAVACGRDTWMVYETRKVCVTCQREWMGATYHEYPESEQPRIATCRYCMDAADVLAQARQKPAPAPTPELTRPKRVAGDDD